MPSLTSCYFCGDAVGASLSEYGVPEAAPADEQVSVTLCADCRGKLSALFEELDPIAGSLAQPSSAPSSAERDAESDDESAAVPESDAEADDADEHDADSATDLGDPDLDPVAGDREPVFAAEDGAVPGEEDPTDPAATEEPVTGQHTSDEADGSTSAGEATDSHGETTDSASSRSPSDVADADESAIDDGDPDAGTDAASGEASAADAIAAPPAEDGTVSVDADAAETDTTDTDETDAEPATVEAGTSGAGTATRTGPDESTASSANSATSSADSATDPLADVRPRTYNRVVRLLQNREFPVDRADFEALATSAYELDHGECAAALDAAVEKGLLEERGGSLHRPS